VSRSVEWFIAGKRTLSDGTDPIMLRGEVTSLGTLQSRNRYDTAFMIPNRQPTMTSICFGSRNHVDLSWDLLDLYRLLQ
jgi:hypothetical protein